MKKEYYKKIVIWERHPDYFEIIGGIMFSSVMLIILCVFKIPTITKLFYSLFLICFLGCLYVIIVNLGKGKKVYFEKFSRQKSGKE